MQAIRGIITELVRQIGYNFHKNNAELEYKLIEQTEKDIHSHYLAKISEEMIEKIIIEDFKRVGFDDWQMARRLAKSIVAELTKSMEER